MNKFEELMGLLELLQNDNYGEWVFETERNQMPYITYSDTVHKLIQAVYNFSDNNPDYDLTNYDKILEDRGLKWSHQILESADVSDMDAQGVMAILMGLVRGERFCSGAILTSLRKGVVQKWLQRLKQISEQE